jgi:hypothetical protein
MLPVGSEADLRAVQGGRERRLSGCLDTGEKSCQPPVLNTTNHEEVWGQKYHKNAG